MKTKILTSAILLFFGLKAFSFDKEKPASAPTKKEVTVLAKFNKVLIDNNIKLVLVPENLDAITIAADQSLLDKIDVKVSKGILTISSKKGVAKESVVVYVPAADVTSVELKTGASVSSQGTLQNSDLTVLLNAESKVDLMSLGNIIIKEGDDCDVVYQKYEKTKVIMVK